MLPENQLTHIHFNYTHPNFTLFIIGFTILVIKKNTSQCKK